MVRHVGCQAAGKLFGVEGLAVFDMPLRGGFGGVVEKEKEKRKQDDSLVGTGIAACTSPPPIDGKKGFLARFKRHPS